MSAQPSNPAAPPDHVTIEIDGVDVRSLKITSLRDLVNVVNLVNQAGGKAVGLTGKDSGMIRAKKLFLPNKENPAARTNESTSANKACPS